MSLRDGERVVDFREEKNHGMKGERGRKNGK